MSRTAVILVADGVQDQEFFYPYYRLQEADFRVQIAAQDASRDHIGKYGIKIHPNISTTRLNGVDWGDVSVIIVPGGWQCPEILRQDRDVLGYLQWANLEENRQRVVIGAICHGPQVLISAGICKDRVMTCYKGMKDDLVNAGAKYLESDIVYDDNIITSPHYNNNPDFMRAVLIAANQRLNPDAPC